jgi:nucleoside phosphorylase
MTSAPYLIITALPEEREGIAKYLPGLQVHSGDGTGDARVYYQARLNLPGKPLVVVTTIGRPGRVSAATAATVAIKRWCPDVVLLVGIAGGFQKRMSVSEMSSLLVTSSTMSISGSATDVLRRFTPMSGKPIPTYIEQPPTADQGDGQAPFCSTPPTAEFLAVDKAPWPQETSSLPMKSSLRP